MDPRVNRSYALEKAFAPSGVVFVVLAVGACVGAAVVGRADLLPLIVVTLLLSCVALGVFLYRVEVARLMEMWDQADAAVSAQRRDRAIGLLDAAPQAAARAEKHFVDARAWLDHAEAEFAEGAFAPFWDAVEAAARHIGAADDELRSVAASIQEYQQLAAGLSERLPPFPTGIVPSNTLLIHQLREVVRKGQKSFHFASIYEQRRTSQILIAGFTNLGDALERLGSQLASTLEEIQVRLDELIQFQHVRSTGDAEEEYLRGTQRRRRPAS
jgi:hypothetical protein